MNREYTDTGIRINRGQRRWHKYGSKIVAACIAAAAIIAIIAIAASVGRGGSGTGNNVANATSVGAGNSTPENSGGDSGSAVTTPSGSEETSEAKEGESEGSEEATTATSESAKKGTLSGKPEEEEFSSDAFYEDAAFIGDIFVYGIDEYEYVPSSNLYSATFMTAAKALDLTDDVASQEPSRILVMLGYDDENLAEDRTAEASAESIIALLKELKEKNPDAKIYAVSELPITEEYNDAGGDYVSQEDLDKINSLVKTGAAAEGIGYIDAAECLKDGEYMSEDYTNDGCRVKKEYYPFILNGIAKAAV